MQNIEKKQHIPGRLWELLEEGSISSEEFGQILEHTCSCTWCADRMAEILEQEHAPMAILPPSYLKDQILMSAARPEVRAAVTRKRISKNMQLILYGLKVSAAVAASLFMLAVTTRIGGILESPSAEEYLVWQEDTPEEERISLLERMSQSANRITDTMNNFTDQIVNGGKKQ